MKQKPLKDELEDWFYPIAPLGILVFVVIVIISLTLYFFL